MNNLCSVQSNTNQSVAFRTYHFHLLLYSVNLCAVDCLSEFSSFNGMISGNVVLAIIHVTFPTSRMSCQHNFLQVHLMTIKKSPHLQHCEINIQDHSHLTTSWAYLLHMDCTATLIAFRPIMSNAILANSILCSSPHEGIH